MQANYDAWIKSSHRHVATCNDCHTPKGMFAKYVVKAVNGFNHSLAFTTGKFAEPIRIKGFNLEVAINRCVDCHGDLWASASSIPEHSGGDDSCLRCHGSVGHK